MRELLQDHTQYAVCVRAGDEWEYCWFDDLPHALQFVEDCRAEDQADGETHEYRILRVRETREVVDEQRARAAREDGR